MNTSTPEDIQEQVSKGESLARALMQQDGFDALSGVTMAQVSIHDIRSSLDPRVKAVWTRTVELMRAVYAVELEDAIAALPYKYLTFPQLVRNIRGCSFTRPVEATGWLILDDRNTCGNAIYLVSAHRDVVLKFEHDEPYHDHLRAHARATMHASNFPEHPVVSAPAELIVTPLVASSAQ